MTTHDDSAYATPSLDDRFPSTLPDLLSALRTLRQKNPKAVRDTVHLYPASVYAPEAGPSHGQGQGQGQGSTPRDRRITSWKMTEYMYHNVHNQFPTFARGLFTEKVKAYDEVPPFIAKEGNSRVDERIVARGYDKFFNIDEVAWTNWDGMKKHTEAPYYLTLKSNGCLILISALSPTHLLVASKHSLGTTTESAADEALVGGVSELGIVRKDKKGKQKEDSADDTESDAKVHAAVGRRWLKTTLERSGRTEGELAKRLWDDNLTAVLELCDDDFEEHVIATPAHWTGLHLHGLNRNTPLFDTLPPNDVEAFAREFGFIPTKYVTLQTLDEVKAYTDEVARTGSWEGEMIEGFVVRSTVRDTKGDDIRTRPPYRPGTPFFFKVKFEEPYLLYRTWREVTRAMLPLLGNPDAATEAAIMKKVKIKTKRPEVEVYAKWCQQMMKKEPSLFNDYDRGIVRVRERFLSWSTTEGKAEWDEAVSKGKKVQSKDHTNGKVKSTATKEDKAEDGTDLPKKHIIIPIAIPGCGKTLIGHALSYLFGFGHTQSDDVTARKSAPTFLKNIAALLKDTPVVYADRNNHIQKHYDELSEIARNKSLGTDRTLKGYDVRRIAIVWDVTALPYHRVLRICSERVVKRGDNHQTLRPDITAEAEHEAVVGQFLRNFTPPDEDTFDAVITVQVTDSPQEALSKIVDCLVEVLDLKKPSQVELDDALAAAQQYKVTTPYHAPSRVGKAIRYFGLAPEIDLAAVVETILPQTPNESAADFLAKLKASDRITAKPHVTLAHEKSVEAEKEARRGKEDETIGEHERVWNQCKALASSVASPLFSFNMPYLVWDDRVMALILDDIHQQLAPKDGPLELDVPSDVQQNLHVTVGTQSEEISAFESRSIVRKAKEMIDAGNGNESGEASEVVEGGGKVRWIKVEGVRGEGRVKGMW